MKLKDISKNKLLIFSLVAINDKPFLYKKKKNKLT
jgi:hypothetical protein